MVARRRLHHNTQQPAPTGTSASDLQFRAALLPAHTELSHRAMDLCLTTLTLFLAMWQCLAETEPQQQFDSLEPASLAGGPLAGEYLNQLLASTVSMPYVLVPQDGLQRYRRADVQYPNTRFRTQPYKVCRPSTNQIVKFLHALHLARSGSTNQLTRLCDGSQHAAEIDTNVRFVG